MANPANTITGKPVYLLQSHLHMYKLMTATDELMIISLFLFISMTSVAITIAIITQIYSKITALVTNSSLVFCHVSVHAC